jgi:hypothetical protein
VCERTGPFENRFRSVQIGSDRGRTLTPDRRRPVAPADTAAGEDVITVDENVRGVIRWRAGRLAVLIAVLVVVPSVAVATPAATDGSADVPVAAAPSSPTARASTPPDLASVPPGVPSTSAAGVGTTGQRSAANNTSVSHLDPDDYRGDADLASLRSWAASRLFGSIDDGTLLLDRRQYEAARQLLGESYDEALGRYVDVADATPWRVDDRRARTFQRAGDAQDRYLDALSNYRDTRRAYRDAKAAGDEQAATRLARQLGRDATRVERAGETLVRRYGAVANATDTDLTDPTRRVESVTDRAVFVSETVRNREFVATGLELATGSASGSFLDPVRVQGQLRAANGTPVEGRSVRLRLWGTNRTVRTNATGSFELSVRPVTVDTGRQRVDARYEPSDTAPFLGSTASARVEIGQVSPTIRIDSAPSTVAFGREVRATGRLVANGTPVAGAPVAISVDGTRLATVETGPDGRFSGNTSLPIDVPSGERALRTRVALDGAAVGPAEATRTVAVARTGTNLSADVAVDAESLVIAGRLATTDGRPVDGQSVRVLVEGDERRVVRTDGAGAYETRIRALPDLLGDDQRVNVSVVYTAEATSLAPARATGSVDFRSGPAGTSLFDALGLEFDLGNSLAGLLGLVGLPSGSDLIGRVTLVVAVLVLAGLGVFESRRRLRVAGETGDDPTDDIADEASPVPTPAGSADSGPVDGASEHGVGDGVEARPSFADSHARLRAGESEAAVVLAYRRTRRHLARTLGVEDDGTAGQFRDACERAGLEGDRLRALHGLFAAYERAAFGGTPIPTETAVAAISDAVEATATDDLRT